jgi:hypothetical protein
MSSRIRTYSFIVLISLLFFAFSGAAYAREIWINGTVTKAPWTDGYQYIEIDHAKYTFMPKVLEIRLPHRYDYARQHKKNDELRFIQKGQEVWMKVQGRRIYEILVEK